jgi:hypothetical protein
MHLEEHQMITVTQFRPLPADRDHPARAVALAGFPQPDGTVKQAKISLFTLEDGRIGVGVYPSKDRGAVLRWDDGPNADPRVIFWEAPHCPDDECGSVCGH